MPITEHQKGLGRIRGWKLKLGFICMGLSAFCADAANVTLAWDAAMNPTDGTPVIDVTGYRLYYGTTPNLYSNMVDTGLSLTTTVTNLTDGITNYFAVVAYNNAGAESSLSPEVAWAPSLSTALDSDRDGMPDSQELIAGTDPNNVNSVLKMTIANPPNGQFGRSFALQWASVTGKFYTVMRSTDLEALPAFSNTASHIQGQYPTTSFTDTNLPVSESVFYQIQVEP